MELNPLRWPAAAWRLVQSVGQTAATDARGLATDAKREVAWAALALGDTPLPNGIQTALVRGHQLFESTPHGAPLMACPNVQPLGEPVAVPAGRAVELWPKNTGALTGARPARAIALDLPTATEGAVTLTAAGPGTDWGTKGRESAVVSVFVDGRYNQDVVLWGGATPTAYSLALGPLDAGHHTITLAYNQPGSTPGATGATITGLRFEPAGRDLQALAAKYQPFFYGRGLDNNHTDVPLMMWCEATRQGQDTLLSYSVMHSNEDGGTGADPAAEQASWGRETDPDPIMTVVVGPDGAIKETRYVGWLDESSSFHGGYEGSHALLRVAYDNNSYSDKGTSPMLFRPRVQLKDFTGSSRESLMDQNPTFYRISNEELKREGKELTPAEAAAAIANEGKPGFQRPKKVMDLRQYLYVDFGVKNPNHAQLAVAIKLKGRDQWYRSDLGDPMVDVLWSGTGLRTSVPLPAGARPEDVETIRVLDEGGHDVTFEGIDKAFVLDDAYQPHYLALPSSSPAELGAHGTLDIQAGS